MRSVTASRSIIVADEQRLALRVKETTRLLDTYTEILVQQEHTQALLLNPNWHGALEVGAFSR